MKKTLHAIALGMGIGLFIAKVIAGTDPEIFEKYAGMAGLVLIIVGASTLSAIKQSERRMAKDADRRD